MSQTILVVDDSVTVVKFISVALKSKGFSVITASDGMEALEKISSLPQQVALIITDLNMPNLDGYTLIETLRQNQTYRYTPIVILSTEGKASDKEKGISIGASSYLVKPFKPSLLLAEVSKYLKAASVETT
jgi:two-component system chemotaxis response regulator CheY